MNVEIFRLTPEQAGLLRDVPEDLFDDPVDPGAVAEFLADPRHHLLVAADAGRIVGFISAVHYVHPDDARPELWLNEVSVSAACRLYESAGAKAGPGDTVMYTISL